MHRHTTELKEQLGARKACRVAELDAPLTAALESVEAARSEAERILRQYRVARLTDDDEAMAGLGMVEQNAGAFVREAQRAEQSLYRMLQAAQGLDRAAG